MSGDPYIYPGTAILRNKLGIRNAELFDRVERRLVADRITEGVPRGEFDLKHLQTIHRHLFQDIYEWAGEVRSVEIAKDGNQFQFRQYIETGMSDVHRRIVSARYLRGLPAGRFAEQAGAIMGDVNYVHPFREGNGRTQLLYLKQLAERAGHPLNLRHIPPVLWIEASRSAHNADYRPMSAAIAQALERTKDRGRER